MLAWLATEFASSSCTSISSSASSAVFDRASPSFRASSFSCCAWSVTLVFSMFSASRSLTLCVSSSRRASRLFSAPACSSASMASFSAVSFVLVMSDVELVFDFGDFALDFGHFPFELDAGGFEFLRLVLEVDRLFERDLFLLHHRVHFMFDRLH